ncbi:TetR/AcrR family transcriptional regulator [Catenisphaera adipataccumulans]|uniref:AcrR family transcriptional regulator n=1 Tax=Catenisphaera adipataccumulans TaxID=700500 RepID=A0A7W8CW72_9FIRM|nr:TetR/AcrR family transcriptional regulator [Catenisphaera adipataccumulans]MBB5182736.1 AcrR family transcriptional regulator [Catenisphaera adipataccumulans]
MPRYLTEEQRNQKRELLLKAAADLFQTKTYSDITMRELCAAAGIGLGTFFDYFPKKEALFTELIRQNYARWFAKERDWLDAQQVISYHQFKEHLINVVSRTVKEDRFFVRLMMLVSRFGYPSLVREPNTYSETYHTVMVLVEAKTDFCTAAQAREVYTFAHAAVTGYFHFLHHAMLINGESADIEDQLNQAVSCFLDGYFLPQADKEDTYV